MTSTVPHRRLKSTLSGIPGRAIVVYTGSVALCLIALGWIMQLWEATLAVPFIFQGGDELFYGTLIKGMIDNGWYLHNPFVGMPSGLDLHDYPFADNLHFLAMKLLSCLTSNWAIILNLYFLLTFPLVTVTSLFVFRRFGVADPPAVVGSVLYAFLPYHFLRGAAHLFLAAYYLIPLIVMVLLWICTGTPLFGGGGGDGQPRRRWVSPNAIMSIVICLAAGSAGVYYAFFASFFLIIAGGVAFARQRSLPSLLSAGVLLAILVLTFFANITPSLLYAHRHGESYAPRRPPGSAELYGMKITQLVLPATRHRLPYLSGVKDTYTRGTLVANENDMVSLGIIGSLGFLTLIGWTVVGGIRVRHTKLLQSLSALNISALLLATIGGFGSLFAFYVSPQIRGYNRISVYMAFFSLFAVVLCLDSLAQRAVRSKRGRGLFYASLGPLLVIGILDQTSPTYVPLYSQRQADYASDADFIRRIESSAPQGGMIFQLPYMPFPEGPMIHRLLAYDHLRGYLHSKTLRWSFGAMKFRDADAWQKQVAAKPPGELVESLKSVGFHGIYLDRHGYPDQGAELEASLAALLHARPVISANQRLVFFGL
jgi:phosphoglycerol transferase